MTKSDPYHNTYSCPGCEDDVEVPLPMAAYVTCPSCRRKLKVMVDAEFDENGWHDRTELDFADDSDPEREHMKRMIAHAKHVEQDCEHKYAEQETAPLGVKCVKCGHFVGAWE